MILNKIKRIIGKILMGENTISWNPMISGYPPEFCKKYWDLPSGMIGKEFTQNGIKYRVSSWYGCGDHKIGDFDEDDGVMEAIEISKE